MNRNFYETYFFSTGKIVIRACLFMYVPSLLFSCNIINPAEPVPAYIHVDTFSLTTDPLAQGSNSSNIRDVWVYVDENIIGAFEMPVTLPVLAAGSHRVTLRPGILIDGIAATRTVYPFYTGFDTTINFVSQKTEVIIPKIKYYSTTKFRIEDFDQTGFNLVRTSRSDTGITPLQNANSFEGKSGAVYLDDGHPFFECAWKDSFLLPTVTQSYVELNYKCDNTFTVGLISYVNNNVYYDDIVNFKASQTWKKEYINLGPILINAPNATGFKIYINAFKDNALSNASLYFDNIKVVY